MDMEELLSFGQAIDAMKSGKRVRREGWNGKGMWLVLRDCEDVFYKNRPVRPHVMMCTAQGDYVPWVASQTDILADDWRTFPECT
jgi:hypothetical protein